MVRYVAVDVETTGLNKSKDRVIEFAAIDLSQLLNACINQTVQSDALHLLINPEKGISAKAQSVHGISLEDLAEKPTFIRCHKQIHAFLKGAILVGHNVEFDVSFLTQEFQRCGINFSPRSRCTLKMAKAQFKGLTSYRLEALNDEFRLHQGIAHRALDDAITAGKLFVLIENLKNQAKQPAKTPLKQNSNLDRSAKNLGKWVGKFLRGL